MTPKIMAHGGAWDWDDALDEGKKAGLQEAVSIGYEILRKGGSALDAVEQTVVALENNPVFDAGTGAHLNRDGVAQLDALITDGSSHNFGAVGGVTRIKNPVALARKIMEETPQCFFVGDGADRMAEELGIELVSNDSLLTDAMREYYRAQRTDGIPDTVGAVAIDSNGNVASATSTSGTPLKPAGRVGDSPLYGAGGFAENGIGAAGSTGKGEHIMRVLLAKYSCDKMAEGLNAVDAAKATMKYIDTIFDNSMVGIILVDAQGNLGAAHTTPKIALGWVDEHGAIHTATKSSF